MSDIAELLAEDELDVHMMAQMKHLPKSQFLRFFGDHTRIQHEYMSSEKGRVVYEFTLEYRDNKRVYINHGINRGYNNTYNDGGT